MIASFFNVLFQFIEFAILIDVILSWLPQGRENTFVEIIHTITEPFLKPGRMIQERLVPGLMIDFSPILALFIVGILRKIVYILLEIL